MPSFHFTPALAERWEQPDPLTLVFHLRSGVRFHDGRAHDCARRSVVGRVDAHGAVISPKANAYASIGTMEALDDRTVVMHLKHPDNFLLTNLSTGALGVIPEGSGSDFWRHPIGTGPFRFVSQQIDQDVVIERNPLSWSVAPKLERVRFAVVPDAITESLELEKGLGRCGRQFPAHGCARGACQAAKPAHRIDRRHADSISQFQCARSRCSRMRGCARLSPAPSIASLIVRTLLRRPCAARDEPAAAASLGLERRWAALRLRSRARRATARCGRLSARAATACACT